MIRGDGEKQREQSVVPVEGLGRLLGILVIVMPAIGFAVRWASLGIEDLSPSIAIASAATVYELAATGFVALWPGIIGFLTTYWALARLAPYSHHAHRASHLRGKVEEELGPGGIDDKLTEQMRILKEISKLRKWGGGYPKGSVPDDLTREIDELLDEVQSLNEEIDQELPGIEEELEQAESALQKAETLQPGWMKRLKRAPRMGKIAIVLIAICFVYLLIFHVTWPAGWILALASVGAGFFLERKGRPAGELPLSRSWPAAAGLTLAAIIYASLAGPSPPAGKFEIGSNDPQYYVELGRTDEFAYLRSCLNQRLVEVIPIAEIDHVQYLATRTEHRPSLWEVLGENKDWDLGLRNTCPDVEKDASDA